MANPREGRIVHTGRAESALERLIVNSNVYPVYECYTSAIDFATRAEGFRNALRLLGLDDIVERAEDNARRTLPNEIAKAKREMDEVNRARYGTPR